MAASSSVSAVIDQESLSKGDASPHVTTAGEASARKRPIKKRTRKSTDEPEDPDNPSKASKWRTWKPAPKQRHVGLIHQVNEDEIQKGLATRTP